VDGKEFKVTPKENFMEKHILAYVTVPDKKWGEKIAKHLLEENLIACANLSSPVTSIYRFEGKEETSQEIVIWMKTIAENKNIIVEKVMAMHPYENPAVVFLPILGGSPAFLSWIDMETKAQFKS